MDIYPKELTYVAKKLVNYRRQTRMFYPRTHRTADANEWTEIVFPSGVIDLSSFSLLGDVLLVRNADSPVQCCLCKDIESYVSEIQVSINGEQIESVQDFNHLWRILLLFKHASHRGVLQLGKDFSDGAAPVTLPNIGLLGTTNGVIRPSNGIVPTAVSRINAHKFMLRHFPGFLSCDKLLDLEYIGTLKVRIKWASAAIIPGLDTDTFQVQNLTCFASYVTLHDDVYTGLMSTIVNSVGISIPFKRWTAYRGPPLDHSLSVSMTVDTRCLNAIIGFIINDTSKYGATYFERVLSTIEYSHFTIENKLYPEVPVTPSESFALVQMCHSDIYNGKDIADYATWLTKEGFFMHRFSHNDTLDYMSGLQKNNDEPINVSWVIKCRSAMASGDYGTPYMFAECTSLLTVSESRKVTFQY